MVGNTHQSAGRRAGDARRNSVGGGGLQPAQFCQIDAAVFQRQSTVSPGGQPAGNAAGDLGID